MIRRTGKIIHPSGFWTEYFLPWDKNSEATIPLSASHLLVPLAPTPHPPYGKPSTSPSPPSLILLRSVLPSQHHSSSSFFSTDFNTHFNPPLFTSSPTKPEPRKDVSVRLHQLPHLPYRLGLLRFLPPRYHRRRLPYPTGRGPRAANM